MSIGPRFVARPAIVRWPMFALLSIALILPIGAVSAAPLGGVLSGKVTMLTMGASLPPTPITVDLLFYNPGFFRINDEAVDFKETITAPDGSFTFTGLDTSPAGVYRVVARYKGVTFEPAPHDFTDQSGATQKTTAVRFPNNASTASIDVPIAELASGITQPGFTVASHSVVINEVRPQFYSVVEAYMLQNTTDRALVGTLKPDGTLATGVPIVFSLPPNATEITTNRTDLLASSDLTGQKLTPGTPIPPGSSDITCAYSLQGGAAGVTVNRTLDYPTAKFEVLISDTKQAVNPGPGLNVDAPIQPGQAATPFKRLNATNVPQGQAFALVIGPSPATPTGTATAATDNRNFFERIRAGVSSPALLALAAVCLILMIVVLRLPAKPTPKSPDTRAPSRKTPTTARAKAPAALAAPQDDLTPAPVATTEKRTARGRPHDAEVDADEAEIEAANRNTE